MCGSASGPEIQDHRRWRYHCRLLDYQSSSNNLDHRIPGIIEYLGSSSFFGSLKSILSFGMTLRPSDQFEKKLLDHNHQTLIKLIFYINCTTMKNWTHTDFEPKTHVQTDRKAATNGFPMASSTPYVVKFGPNRFPTESS